jgi:hypothetical protein
VVDRAGVEIREVVESWLVTDGVKDTDEHLGFRERVAVEFPVGLGIDWDELRVAGYLVDEPGKTEEHLGLLERGDVEFIVAWGLENEFLPGTNDGVEDGTEEETLPLFSCQ